MNTKRWAVGAAVFGLFWFAGAVRAEDPPAAADEAPATAAILSAEQIAELIRQLDAAGFAERQAASLQLAEAGQQAVPALEAAAIEGSREVVTRCIDLLKRLFDTGGDEAKAAAEAALKRLAASENPAVAKRAQSALEPKPEGGANVPLGGFGNGIIQLAPAQIQVRVQAVQQEGGRRISIRNVNGVKEIEVQEKGRSVKITDDPDAGIKMEITEKNKEGKEETKRYGAKNAAELEKNHPEAYKVYKEFAEGNAGGVIQIQGGIQLQPAPNAVPVPLPVPQAQPALPQRVLRLGGNAEVAKQLAEIVKRLDDAASGLEKAVEGGGDPDLIKAALDQLQKAKEELEEAQKQLVP